MTERAEIWTLEHAIEIAKIGSPYRSYDGTGSIWVGRNEGLPDGGFTDWGLARATTIILNAAINGKLRIADGERLQRSGLDAGETK